MKTLKVRNKNVMKELLQSGVIFDKISVVTDLEQDDRTKEILSIAKDRGMKIKMTSIQKMTKRRTGDTREVLAGFIKPNNIWTLRNLLDDIYEKGEEPFFFL